MFIVDGEKSALYTYVVRSSDCDPELNLRAHEYLTAAQEAADIHSRTLGIAGSQLSHRNIGWMISAIRMDFTGKKIGPGEKLLCRTWCCRYKGVRFDRQYLFYKEREEDSCLLGSMQADWFLIDLEKRRPIRPKDVMSEQDLDRTVFHQCVYTESTDKVMALPEAKEERVYTDQTVYLSQIDVNGHLNHINYLSQAVDTLHLFFAQKDDVKTLPSPVRFVLNYVTEVKPFQTMRMVLEDHIELRDHQAPIWQSERNRNEKMYGAEAYNLSTGELSFKAELILAVSK